MNKYFSNKKIAVIAIMSAIAGFLMIIDFPLTFIAPSFYKLDLSDLPCLIVSFSLGPIAGTLTELLKILIKLLLKPTSTAFIGELSNFLCGISMIVPAGLIYKNKHSKEGATFALVISSLIFVVISFLINYFVTIPFYVSLYHMPLDSLLELGKQIFPIINSKFMFVLLCVSIFNALKAILTSLFTYFLYKRVSPIIKK